MSGNGTRTDEVYRRLRADILGGALKPGDQLQFARLKNDYGASMGVLREALVRLTAEGLTVNQAQHGFRVITLSIEDLVDLTNTRCLIESLVLRDAVENGDIEWESRIVAAHHRMERTPKETGEGPAFVTAAWAQAHHEFHMALLGAAKSKRLQHIAANLRASAEVYRRWSMPFETVRRDVSAEHLEILNLALKREAKAAAAALSRHLELTRELIVRGAEKARQ
jgi:DNA-binding GntR family transcriptional regulator